MICLIFLCNCFLPLSSVFFFQVCAEAFNPDEEEEDTEQRVRASELHHVWLSLQLDRQMSVRHLFPTTCAFHSGAVSYADTER